MIEPAEEDRTQAYVPLNPGTVVSHFHIVQRIGSGGMGEVYLADDTQLDRRVALKFLPNQYVNDSDLKNRFLREARAAAKLNHPNIITIYEVGEFNGRPYFAMEYVEGKSVHIHVQDSPLQIPQILTLAIQIGEGLKRAHDQGIIHRDIKSANVIVGTEGRARILDFGLAAVRGGEKLTRDGSTLGTVAYMSPEQVRGQAIDIRSDLFSFGVVLYELVTGRTPFKRDSDASTMNAINAEAAEPLARYKANVPPALQHVIDKALQKDPATRYQSAADIVADLRRVQSDISAPSVPSMLSSKPILAVLPFDNTGSADREYFADGITDEVIARLARLKEIGVIAQSSAAQYKKSPKRPREIGQELGCGYLLQGSIRWDESSQPVRVRINAKLTKVQDETYLWAETYDRVMEQIFAVQSEIADQVAKAMGITLSSARRSDQSSGGTTNVEAYDLYLRAREFFPGTIQPDLVRRAAALLRKAIELDPEFPVARALLGWTEIALYWLADRARSHLDAGKELIDSAFNLAPGLFEAHVALGFYHYWGQYNYAAALEEFDKAMALRPNDAEVLFSIGVVEHRQGKMTEFLARIDLALRLNPRSQLLLLNQAQTMLLTKRYDEAVALADRAALLRPDVPVAWSVKALAVASRDGSLEAGASVFREASRHLSPSLLVASYPSILIYLAYHDNDPGKALDTLELHCDGIDNLSFLLARLILAQVSGRKQMARAYAEATVWATEHRISLNSDDSFALALAAHAYLELGKLDKARERATAISKTKPYLLDVVERSISQLWLSDIYAKLGEIEKALDLLEEERSHPSWLSSALVAQKPSSALFSGYPRFWQILGLPDPNKS